MGDSGIRNADGGVSLGKTLGARRLKALLLLSQHPEMDEPDWQGQLQCNFGKGLFVSGTVHPAAVELTA